MKIEFDAWEAETLHTMLKHYVHLMVSNKCGSDAVINAAFDYMERLENFMTDVSDATEERKYDHIDRTNWAE